MTMHATPEAILTMQATQAPKAFPTMQATEAPTAFLTMQATKAPTAFLTMQAAEAPRAWKAHGLIIVRAQPTGKAAWPGWLASQSLKGSKFGSLRFLLPRTNQKIMRRRWAPQRSLITRFKLNSSSLN